MSLLSKKNLDHYINKLKEKSQTDQQQKQAINAISLFYGVLGTMEFWGHLTYLFE